MAEKTTRPLSAQQKKFTELVVSGRPAGRAYEEAGYSSKGASADVSASKLLRNPKVEEYLGELRAEVKKGSILTAQERMEWLSRAVTTPLSEVDESSDICVEHVEISGEHGDHKKVKKPDPIRAIDLLNKMDGSYAPEQHEHSFAGIGSIIDEIQGG